MHRRYHILLISNLAETTICILIVIHSKYTALAGKKSPNLLLRYTVGLHCSHEGTCPMSLAQFVTLISLSVNKNVIIHSKMSTARLHFWVTLKEHKPSLGCFCLKTRASRLGR